MSATAVAVSPGRTASTDQSIIRMALRQIVRGAIFFGLFAGLIMTIQGFGMAKTYTSPVAREQFAATLSSVPALGLLYGEQIKTDTPAGYMVYRTLPLATLIGALWGLLTMTRLLRGQEEDGRWEMLLSGQTTSRRALCAVLTASGLALGIAYLVASVIIILTGSSSDIQLPVGKCLLLAAAVIGPAAVFMMLGALTSQLASTRRRAVLYGVIPLLVLFALRSVGNVLHDVSWLKSLTPFGWADKLHIVIQPQLWWLLPFVLVALALPALAIYLAGRRDVGEGLIAESDTARPNFRLLNQPWAFSFRQLRWNILSWLLGSVFVVALIASISSLAGEMVDDSDSISQALASLSGNSDQVVALAFLGIGAFLVAVLVMVMVTTGLAAARNEEAKSYLDNLFVRPLGRVRWLAGRLAVLSVSAAGIAVIASLVGWAVANRQGLDVSLSAMLLGYLSLLGPVLLLLGVGVLVYGIKPRWAAPLMYGLIIWSFVIDLIGSVVSVDRLVANTSLLHYVALTPAASPDWKAFWILTVAGIGLMALGALSFKRRDLVTE